ncbi:Cytochrome c domain-containing protein [Bordetella sputigena]|uniref:c-type cytochrome n=1 Tax=Bordetella sputigena TaxID=1416810 RepID=UPI0039EED8F2
MSRAKPALAHAASRVIPRAGMAAALLILVLGGCERSVQNMYDQPRGKPYRASPQFPDGASARTPFAGTEAYARGTPADATSGREGGQQVARDAQARAAASLPAPVTPAMLKQGQTLYGVFCMPCHSPAGDGDGRIVERGFPAPPTYHSDRLRQAPDRHIYDVISNGYGVMASYGNRIRPEDRWAIVAYVRALQLSQHAAVEDLPPDVRQRTRSALASGGPERPGNPTGDLDTRSGKSDGDVDDRMKEGGPP